MRVLIIEDERDLAKLIAKLVKGLNYVSDISLRPNDALSKLEKNKYDLILIDVGLPEMSGIELCRKIRKKYDTPVIFISGWTAEKDKVKALNAGADDYVIKPFRAKELQARIKAVLRRPKTYLANVLVFEDLQIDLNAMTVKRDNITIELMPKEFALLEYMMRKSNQAISREELLRHVWGIYSKTSSNRLEVYIRYLRKKVDGPFNKNLIQTVRGFGYRLSS